jgi:hypothetical protein
LDSCVEYALFFTVLLIKKMEKDLEKAGVLAIVEGDDEMVDGTRGENVYNSSYVLHSFHVRTFEAFVMSFRPFARWSSSDELMLHELRR